MTWASNYVGIPFEWRGASRQGCDCWGLVRLVCLEVFGHDLPPLISDISRAQDGGDTVPTRWTEEVSHKAIEIGEAKEGDLLHMWGMYGAKKRPLHIGIFVDGDHVLHTLDGIGSVIEPLTGPHMSWRPIGAYRLV